MSSKNLLTSIILPLLAVSLVASSVDAKPRQQPAASIQEVQMVGTDSRQYAVLAMFNGAVPVRAVVDTGATQTYLPFEVFEQLVKSGAVLESDVLPRQEYTVVGGKIFNAHRVRLTLTLGGWRIPNVLAVVGYPGGEVLIGSDVLQRFQSFGVDHTRGILRLGVPR
jgi:predicted aspartyl protease